MPSVFRANGERYDDTLTPERTTCRPVCSYHTSGESSRAAGGVENRVARDDVQETSRGRLDQHRLVIVAVTDPVVPPAGIRVPDPAILVGLFGELSVLTLDGHVLRPMLAFFSVDAPGSRCPYAMSPER